MTTTRKELLLHIAQIKDNIRKKFSALRNNDLETQRELTLRYKPLIKPLKSLTKNIMKKEIKEEVKEEPIEEPMKYEPLEDEPPEDEPSDNDTSEEDSEISDLPQIYEEDVPSLPSSDGDDSWQETVDELLAKYLKFIVEDGHSKADFTYGIIYDDGWRMGRYPVQFKNNDIIIRDKRYKGTPGLFELIFKKHPNNIFTEDDLKTYKEMLIQTKAHVGKDGKVISSRGYKYTNIISNMFPPRRKLVERVMTPILTRTKRALSKDDLANEEKRKKLGDGIMLRMTKNRIDYRHWDDPNELCERLFLLIASKEAGNTGLDGEIISILEELKEAGHIKDFDNVEL